MLKKRVSNILFALLILFQAAILYAAERKVMVSIFESKTNDDDLAKKASIISAKEVMRSDGFIYVSPSDYIEAVIGNGRISKKDSAGLEEEYSVKDLDEVTGKFKSYHGSMNDAAKCLEAADIAIGGSAERKGDLVKIEATITDMRNQRSYSAVVECREDRMDDEMRKAVKGLLEKISKAKI